MRNPLIPTLLLVSALACAGCASAPVAPEGHHLVLQLEGVLPVAVDTLRVTFTPRMDTMGGMFEMIETQTYEGGAITVSVDPADGALIVTLTGDWVRANAMTTDDPLEHRVILEIWSDDPAMNAAPQVRATVIRASEQIATGAGFLAAWPPPIGATATDSVIRVPCSTGFTTQCMGM